MQNQLYSTSKWKEITTGYFFFFFFFGYQQKNFEQLVIDFQQKSYPKNSWENVMNEVHFKGFKGMLQSIFCIDVNTHIDRKWKIMQNLF